MNFHMKLPFILFALAALTCLIGQIEQHTPSRMRDECEEGGETGNSKMMDEEEKDTYG